MNREIRKQEGEDMISPEFTERNIRLSVAPKQKGDVIRTITISANDGIKALYAVNRKIIVTYLFQKSEGWPTARAEAWIKEHHKSEKSLIEKSMKKVSRFSFEIPVLKARATVIKDADGNDEEIRFIEGVASSTDVDLHGDKMAPSAIESMADSIKQHVIGLNAEHDKSWQSDLGEVTKFEVTEDFRLVMEAKLDKTSKANDLWYALTEKNKKLGLSIGGFVKDFKIEIDEESGEWQRTFTNIELDHVAVVSSPANPKTWVSSIAKSVDKGVVKKQEDETIINNNDSTNMKKNLPLETEVKKEEEVVTTPASEETTVTPENGESATVVDETVATETKVKTEGTEETGTENTEAETTSEETTTEEPAESTEETTTEEVKEEVVTEGEATAKAEGTEEEQTETPTETPKEGEVVEEKTEKSKEINEEAIVAKAVGEFNKLFKSEEITKTLSTLTEVMKELKKGNEELVKSNEELSKRVAALENQPAGRKVSVDKGMGNTNGIHAEQKTLAEALKEAEKKFQGKTGLFAEKQRIRSEYASMGIFE